MGTDKLLLPFGKGTVLSTVVNSVREAGFTRLHVVTSAGIASVLRSAFPGIDIVVNNRPELGQSTSLRLGIQALGPSEVPFGLLLGDMPMVSGCDFERLRERFLHRPSGKTALVPMKEGRFGHPSFYEAVWKDRLATAEGDSGGREVLRRYFEEILVDTGEEGCFLDMDTPGDYLALQERLKGGEPS